MKYSQTIGIDFGTENFLAFIREKGVLICEPSLAAIERGSGRIAAVGVEAKELMKRFPENFDAVYPIKNGLITDYKIAAGMLGMFLKKICAKQILKPKAVIAIPLRAGEVSEKALISAALDGGAVSAVPLREPFAAASGIGFDLTMGKSTMIIDIGAGTTDVSVISLGKMAVGTSSEAAGDRMTRELLKYIRKEERLEVGDRAAEHIKMTAGSLTPKPKDIIIKIRGREKESGLPQEKEISTNLFPEIFSSVAEEISDLALQVIERIPPEIREEIRCSGIHLTGGGCNLDGMEEFLSKKIGIPCKKTKNPLQTVAVGAGMWQ